MNASTKAFPTTLFDKSGEGPDSSFGGFNPLDTTVLDGIPLRFTLRNTLYWKIAGAIHAKVDALTNGGIKSWLLSIHDTDEESMDKAEAYTKTLCSMVGNRRQFLKNDLDRDKAIASDPRWATHGALQLMSLALRHLHTRRYDDVSIAFYASALAKLTTLEAGYQMARNQAVQIENTLTQAERASDPEIETKPYDELTEDEILARLDADERVTMTV